MISAIPGIPQDVTAYKVTPSSGDDCIVVVNWKPPSNINMTHLKHYMVESPSGNFTTTKTANAAALLIHHCRVKSNTSITIHAIDRCDRNGVSSDNITIELLGLPSNPSRTTEAKPEQHEFKNGMYISCTEGVITVLSVS